MQARWYDPHSSLFTSPDPEMGDAADPMSRLPYAYCAGDPVYNADPTGKTAKDLLNAMRNPFLARLIWRNRALALAFLLMGRKGSGKPKQSNNPERAEGKSSRTADPPEVPSWMPLPANIKAPADTFSFPWIIGGKGSFRGVRNINDGNSSQNIAQTLEWLINVTAAYFYVRDKFQKLGIPLPKYPRDYFKTQEAMMRCLEIVKGNPSLSRDEQMKRMEEGGLALQAVSGNLIDYILFLNLYGGDPSNIDYRFDPKSPTFRQAHARLETWWETGYFLEGDGFDERSQFVWQQGFRYSAEGKHGMALFKDVWPMIQDLLENTPGTTVTGPP